jgi:curved DNA-binding protein CbpA
MAIRSRTYYTVLGVSRQANKKELAAAYRETVARLQKRADTGDDVARNEIDFASKAYATLSNEMQRERYDDQLDAEEAATRREVSPDRSKIYMALIALLVVALALGWYQHVRARDARLAALALEEKLRVEEAEKNAAAREFLHKQEEKERALAEAKQASDDEAATQRLRSDSRVLDVEHNRQERTLQFQERQEALAAEFRKRQEARHARDEDFALRQRQQHELDAAQAKLHRLENN